MHTIHCAALFYEATKFEIPLVQIFCLTWSTHADLLQVFIFDVVEVRQARDVELVSDAFEVLLQLYLQQQLQQPFCSLLALHAAAQSLESKHTTLFNPSVLILKPSQCL